MSKIDNMLLAISLAENPEDFASIFTQHMEGLLAAGFFLAGTARNELFVLNREAYSAGCVDAVIIIDQGKHRRLKDRKSLEDFLYSEVRIRYGKDGNEQEKIL